MTLIEKDQEVYVISIGGYSTTEPTPRKFVVVDANKSSFYAIPTDACATSKPKRFSQRGMLHKTGYGYDYKAYRTEEEFWNLLERGKKIKELRKELQEQINSMGLEKLEAVTSFIDSLK